jgi:hypothetical protein
MAKDNFNKLTNFMKKHYLPISSFLIAIMITGILVMPGNLSPMVQVSADFGAPYDEDIEIYRVFMTFNDGTGTGTVYYWENGVNGSTVINIPGVYDSGSGYTYVYLTDIEVEVNINETLFKDSDVDTNSYCRFRYWNPISSEWVGWYASVYPEVSTAYVAQYHFEPGIYLYADDSTYTLQVELWGIMA